MLQPDAWSLILAPPPPTSEKWRMVLDVGVHCLLGVVLGCMAKAFFVFCPRQCTGKTLRLARCWKNTPPCKVQEIHSALQGAGNTLRLSRRRKYTPPCKVLEIHSALQGAGNTLRLARCRKNTPPCKVQEKHYALQGAGNTLRLARC